MRANAGRKSHYHEATTIMRVPVSKKQLVKQFLQQVSNDSSALSVAPATLVFPSHLYDLNPNIELKPVRVNSYYEIPRVQELIPAGFPSPAEDHIEDVLDLNEHLIRNKSATFVGRVGSLSMRDAGFEVGDEILIDRSIEARHKDVVIAMIDNKFTMKRLMLCEYEDDADCNSPNNNGKPLSQSMQDYNAPLWFKAENPEFKHIYPQEGQTIVIIGVVTYNIKKVINR